MFYTSKAARSLLVTGLAAFHANAWRTGSYLQWGVIINHIVDLSPKIQSIVLGSADVIARQASELVHLRPTLSTLLLQDFLLLSCLHVRSRNALLKHHEIQKQITHGKRKVHSRQKEFAHGKSKSLTVRTNSLTKQINSE